VYSACSTCLVRGTMKQPRICRGTISGGGGRTLREPQTSRKQLYPLHPLVVGAGALFASGSSSFTMFPPTMRTIATLRVQFVLVRYAQEVRHASELQALFAANWSFIIREICIMIVKQLRSHVWNIHGNT
jgi:hypothetical protein